MVLFLQESIEELNEDISIEEAYEGLIEASLDMQDLTEGLLQEDFLLNEQCKVLTEAEANGKKDNFLVAAVKRIIAFINSVRKKILAFFTKLTTAMGAFLDSLTDKQSSQSQVGENKLPTIEVVIGSLGSAVTLMGILKEMLALRNTPQPKSKMDIASRKFNEVLNKAKGMATGKKTEPKPLSAVDMFLNPKHTMKILLGSKASLNNAETLAKQAESTNDSKKANEAKDATSNELKIAAAVGKLTSFMKGSISKVKKVIHTATSD